LDGLEKTTLTPFLKALQKFQIQRKGYRNQPLSQQDSRRNDAIAVIRAGGERPFAITKAAMASREPVLWDWPKI
jgi:hypothetical protein